MLWENGDQGASSAKWVAQVVNAFVTKQRRLDHNLRIAATPPPAPKPEAAPAAKQPPPTPQPQASSTSL